MLFFCIALFCLTSCGEDTDTNDDPTATCFDNILNQDEEEIDCGGVCEPCEQIVEEPMPTKDYYVKFKANDTWVMDEQNYTANYSYRSSTAVWNPLDLELYIVGIAEGDIEPSEILAMENQTYNFGTWDQWSDSNYTVPFAGFGYQKDSPFDDEFIYRSEAYTSPEGSITIHSVTNNGQLENYPFIYYEVTGSFEGKVKSNNNEELNITEGTFKVYFVGDL